MPSISLFIKQNLYFHLKKTLNIFCKLSSLIQMNQVIYILKDIIPIYSQLELQKMSTIKTIPEVDIRSI